MTESAHVRSRSMNLTCEGHAHMLIQSTDLPDRPLLLKLRHGLLLNTQHNNILPPDSNLQRNRSNN